MNKVKVGDIVRILMDAGLEEFDDKYGEVIDIDSEYIYVQLHNAEVIVERYIHEVELVD
mgnify:CR=1 FL=1